MAFSFTAGAQKNQIEKVWYDENKSCKVQIYEGIDHRFYGKIIWLSEPLDKTTGKPQSDSENPDPKLRQRPVNGLVIFNGFSVDAHDQNVYVDGNIYDPDSGKTYCEKITFKGDKLDLRGSLCSFSIFGKTETWTLAN